MPGTAAMTVGEWLRADKSSVRAAVTESDEAAKAVRKLQAEVRAYEGGMMRVTVAETARTDDLSPRFRPDADVLAPTLAEAPLTLSTDKAGRAVATGDASKVTIAANGALFAFDFFEKSADAIPAISAAGLLFENHARKPPPPPASATEPPQSPPESPIPPLPDDAATDDNDASAVVSDGEVPLPPHVHEDEKEEATPEDHAEEDASAVHDYAMGERGTADTTAPPPPQQQQPLNGIDGGWDEYFGGSSDSKPNGPGAVGLDIWFPTAEMLYGIPEHATSVALRNTRGEGDAAYKEPYRLYNLDVFEYELNEPMSLYGAVPLILAHSATTGTTVGMLWLNPTETWIDVNGTQRATQTRWTSEDGVVDIWLLPGPTPQLVFEQYARITGKMPLPPRFAIGYHQCRWNYRDEQDVAEVDAQFDKNDFPYDVIWLDIEHTDGKRYFTWDNSKFANPELMQSSLASKGRKLVAIVDPHIKRDDNYHVHKQASSRQLYVQNSNGNGPYEGSCWPGSSSWVDFLNADARAWWASLFALESYRGSTDALFLWNDMNEPSVFSGPEVTMNKDALHIGHVEHRAVHNIYGLLNTEASYAGMLALAPNRRPFVLTRSFFAGSQRTAAVWTGDNQAKWEYLKDSLPMILSLGIGGMSFAGADVGGFFGNPETELLVRWYQAGVWYPFFRAHAHIETKRREPFLFDNKTMTQLRDAVRTRYAMLPYWYTIFRESSQTGLPVARAMWIEFPRDPRALAIDDEFMVGSSILVHPVTTAGATTARVYLPAGVWFDLATFERIRGPTDIDVSAPIERGAPAFVRGGSVIPRQERPRRSSTLMARDPYTLLVALDGASHAHGSLYLDDGITFDHSKKSAFSLTEFDFANGVLSAKPVATGFTVHSGLERVVIAGLTAAPSKVIAEPGGECSFGWNPVAHTLVVKKPLPATSSIASSWKLTLVS